MFGYSLTNIFQVNLLSFSIKNYILKWFKSWQCLNLKNHLKFCKKEIMVLCYESRYSHDSNKTYMELRDHFSYFHDSNHRLHDLNKNTLIQIIRLCDSNHTELKHSCFASRSLIRITKLYDSNHTNGFSYFLFLDSNHVIFWIKSYLSLMTRIIHHFSIIFVLDLQHI